MGLAGVFVKDTIIERTVRGLLMYESGKCLREGERQPFSIVYFLALKACTFIERIINYFVTIDPARA